MTELLFLDCVLLELISMVFIGGSTILQLYCIEAGDIGLAIEELSFKSEAESDIIEENGDRVVVPVPPVFYFLELLK